MKIIRKIPLGWIAEKDIIITEDGTQIVVLSSQSGTFEYDDNICDAEKLCKAFPELLYHLDILEECKKYSSERYWNKK